LREVNRIDINFVSTTHGAHRVVQNVDIDLVDLISIVMSNQTFYTHHAGLGHTYIKDVEDVLCQILSNTFEINWIEFESCIGEGRVYSELEKLACC
jgi:hypothetical protein